MLISNSQILLHRSIEFLLKTGKKIVLNKGVYTDNELNSLIGMELKSQMLDSRNDIQRTKITISTNNKKRSHTQLDSRKQVIAFQDRVITINIKEAQHPLKRE